ncbi:MAG: hypothetical protein V2B19_09365 [Pseudomonadota bacterium]
MECPCYVKYNRIFILQSFLIFICCISINFEANAADSDFRVFDSIKLVNKPSLAEYGFHPIALFGFSSLWGKTDDKTQLPDKTNLLNLVQGAIQQNCNVICLDIEHWPTIGLPEQIADTIAKMTTIVLWIKSAYPKVLVGYYGIVPKRDYWRAIKGAENDKYKAWQKENDQLKQIADVVDILFPSVYTFYDDIEGWVKYAKAQISEARRYGKPVCAFIWPYYHGSNKILGGKQLSRGYWERELKTLREVTDGIVIWTSRNVAINNPNNWDEEAGWWNATKDFMFTIKVTDKPMTPLGLKVKPQ